jgi:nitrogen fixation/metabolism regulation signal transduction histidine kinase
MEGGGIMLKALISILTGVSLIFSATFTEVASASTEAEKEAKQIEKIKQKIAKRGTGENARIKVELKNNTKLNGYVSEIGDDTFVITTFKTKAATKVAYRDVAHLSGKGLPTGTKVAIIAGVVIALVLVIALVAYPSAASH